MTLSDCYRNFAELARSENPHDSFQHTVKVRRSKVAVVAPHGGGIEPGTSELAAAIAGRDFSLYSFEGLKDERNDRLHLTSTRFDDPACLDLIRTAQWVVTVHGCSGEQGLIFVGGLAETLKMQVIAGLNAAGFPALESSGTLEGKNPRNLCNRGSSGQGVQLELDLAVRRSLFAGLDRSQRRHPKPAFHALAHAIQTLLILYPL